MVDALPPGGRQQGPPSIQHPLPRRPPPADSLSLNRDNLGAASPHELHQRRRTRSTHSQHEPPPYPLPLRDGLSSSLKPPITATSSRSASTISNRYTKDGPFQPFPSLHPSAWEAPRSDTTSKSQSRRRVHSFRREAAGGDTASESGISILSAFKPTREPRVDDARERRRAARDHTDSPLRRWARWSEQNRSPAATLTLSVCLVLLLKWCISLGSYSGEPCCWSVSPHSASVDTLGDIRRGHSASPRRFRGTTPLAIHHVILSHLASLLCSALAFSRPLAATVRMVLSRSLVLGPRLSSPHSLPLSASRRNRSFIAVHRAIRDASPAHELDPRSPGCVGTEHDQTRGCGDDEGLDARNSSLGRSARVDQRRRCVLSTELRSRIG